MPKKKLLKVIRKDIRVFELGEEMVRDIKTQVIDSHLLEDEVEDKKN